MHKLLHFFKSSYLLKIIVLLSLLIYISLIIIYKIKTGFQFSNNDNYLGAFKTFQELGYYDGVSNGTSIFYNLSLTLFSYFTNDIEWSFIILNSLSHIFLLVFGIYLLKKIDFKKDIYFYILVGLFSLFILNQNYFSSASNDAFQAVFILLIFNFLIFKIYKSQKLINFIFVGILTAICLATRPTAIFVIALIVYGLFVWLKNKEQKKEKVLLKLFVLFASFFVFTLIFHYPSIKEKKTLSFYDKRPSDISENWVQRNYLGWKKIEQGKEPLNRDAIWMNTKFEVVKQYLKENGENSLPKSFSQVIKKDPILVFKITIYNLAYSTLRLIRFWGFLLVFMVLPFFKIKKIGLFSKQLLCSNLFIMILGMISITCLTFIEERWLIGYELLIPMSILFCLNSISIDKAKLNMIFSVSLVFISLMNVRSIISYL